MSWRDDHELDEFADVDDADALCRRLLKPSAGRGSSNRHGEAIDLLERVSGSGERGDGLVALLLCTCPRWDRVTGRLIAEIEASGFVPEAELHELAEAFFSDEIELVYPVAWVSPEWLEIDLRDPRSGRVVVFDQDTPARERRRIAPPLRRCAVGRRGACYAPRRSGSMSCWAPPIVWTRMVAGRLCWECSMGRRGSGTASAEGWCELDVDTGMARVRRAALDVLCGLDGPDVAISRARSDRDATVRTWQPRELSLL